MPCLRAAQRSASRVRSTNKDSYRDPNLKAALVPYHPNAPRSRLPVHFQDEAKPFRRFCKPRNEHSYECASFTMAILTTAILTMADRLLRMRAPSPPHADLLRNALVRVRVPARRARHLRHSCKCTCAASAPAPAPAHLSPPHRRILTDPNPNPHQHPH